MNRLIIVASVLLDLSIGALAVGCDRGQQPTTNPPLVIRDVTVIPMDSERVLATQTVVVAGGLISAVGPNVEIPPDARVIDGRERYLMPGLSDMHVHIENDYELPLYLAQGVTTILNMRGRPWHLRLRERLARGDATGPRLLTCSPYLQDVEDPARARQRVEEAVAAGYDCVKIKGDWSETAYRAVVAATRERDIMLVGHAPRNLSFDVVLDGGHQRIAHLEEAVYTTPELDAYIESYRDWTEELPNDEPVAEVGETVEQLARDIRATGIWIVPTQIVIDRYLLRNVAFDELYDRPYMQYLDPLARRRWRSAQQGNQAARFLQQVRLQELMLGAFADEGVKMALGTDAVVDAGLMTMPGWSAHEELQLMVRAGLSPYEVLRSATANAAEFLGEESAGIVRPGNRADLVLLSANPLDDVDNASAIVGVVRAGRWLPRDTLAEMLSDVARGHEPLERRVAKVDSAFEARGPEAAAREYVDGGRDSTVGAYLRPAINAMGYRLLRAGEADSAIAVFQVNVETFPESANGYDSLGEAYLAAGDTARAIEEYRRALAVDSTFTNARQVLDRLEAGSRQSNESR